MADAFVRMMQASKTASFDPVKDRREKLKRERLEYQQQAKIELKRKIQAEFPQRKRYKSDTKKDPTPAQQDINGINAINSRDECLFKTTFLRRIKERNLILPQDTPPKVVFRPTKPFVGFIREMDYYVSPEEDFPILRCMVTQHKSNADVLVEITNACPYFYMSLPFPVSSSSSFRVTEKVAENATEKQLVSFHKQLMEKLSLGKPTNNNHNNKKKKCLVRLELQQKSPVNGFALAHVLNQAKVWVLKVIVGTPQQVKLVRETIATHWPSCELYECNVPFITRIMVDKELHGFGWIQLEPGRYHRIRRDTAAGLEISVSVDHVRAIPTEGTWSKVPELRLISFDCEMRPYGSQMPHPDRDPVLNVVLRFFTQFSSVSKSTVYAFALDSCAPLTLQEEPSCDLKFFSYPLQAKFLETVKRYWHQIDRECVARRAKGLGNDANDDFNINIDDVDQLVPQLKRSLQAVPESIATLPYLSTPWNALTGLVQQVENGTRIKDTSLYISVRDEQEARMLADVMLTLHQLSPHVLTGYNIVGFDIPWLVRRAERLGCREGQIWGTCLDQVGVRASVFDSAATQAQKRIYIESFGWIVFDMYPQMVADHKLDSYRLEVVSTEFLGVSKHNVEADEIAGLWDQSDESRLKLLRYCIQDTLLPKELLIKLQKLTRAIEMCRAVGLTLTEMCQRGRQAQVFSLLLRHFSQKGMIMPWVPQAADPSPTTTATTSSSTSIRNKVEKYAGAMVIPPLRGFYKDPVVTVDFASLYPSIILAYNMCYSTNLHTFQRAAKAAAVLPGGWNDIHIIHLKRRSKARSHLVSEMDLKQAKSVRGLPALSAQELGRCTYFLKSHVLVGGLCHVEIGLLDKRKAVKRLLAQAQPDSNESAILDSRQLALKIVANSAYGFTGAQMYPDFDIAESITEVGTDLINMCKKESEEFISSRLGFRSAPSQSENLKQRQSARVIYGDTDSCMIYLGQGVSVEKAMQVGPLIAKHITQKCPPPTKLEFEKVYCPYLLLNKKRYVAYKWQEKGKPPKIDFKGIELARRGNCAFMKVIMHQCIKLLMDCKIQQAKQHAIDGAVRLLKGQVPFQELLISVSLSKLEYRNPPPHVRLVQEMRKKNPETAPIVGERFQIVYVVAHHKSSEWERMMEAKEALKQRVTLDYRHYFHVKYRLPLGRLFALVLFPDAEIPDDNAKEAKKALDKLGERAAAKLFDATLQTVHAAAKIQPVNPLFQHLIHAATPLSESSESDDSDDSCSG